MLTADEIIARLGLRPHPEEGGFFAETYRAAERLEASGLPPPRGQHRDLLPADTRDRLGPPPPRLRRGLPFLRGRPGRDASPAAGSVPSGAHAGTRSGGGHDTPGGGACPSVAGRAARGRRAMGAPRLHGGAGLRVRGLRARAPRTPRASVPGRA